MGARAKHGALTLTPRAQSVKGKSNELDLIKIKIALQKALLGWKDKLHTRRKYLQVTYPTKDLCLEYVKNTQKWATKTIKNFLKNSEQKTKISLWRIYGW